MSTTSCSHRFHRALKMAIAVAKTPKLAKYFVAISRRDCDALDPLHAGLPWLTFPVIEWLEANLAPTMRVFEWGSGGSTVFFAQRVGSVVSVEHDADWYARVRSLLEAPGLIARCDYRYCPPVKPAAPDALPYDFWNCTSLMPPYTGWTFKTYVAVIDSFDDGFFDLVLIDGRSRLSCAYRALPKIKSGGFLLADNTDRPDYAPLGQLLSSCQRRDFWGPGPSMRGISCTTLWKLGPHDDPRLRLPRAHPFPRNGRTARG
jgi:hypothetical protein